MKVKCSFCNHGNKPMGTPLGELCPWCRIGKMIEISDFDTPLSIPSIKPPEDTAVLVSTLIFAVALGFLILAHFLK